MRRLWAHIIIAFTCMVAVFASFPSIVKGISTNGDYETRREFTLQLSQREATDEGETPALTDNSAREMASIIEDRLTTAGVSSYELTTSGNDIVTVSFSADNPSQYTQIVTYLTFSGSFALVNQNPDGEPLPGKDFLAGSVYTKFESVNEEPTVIIPVNTESEAYKNIVEWARANPVEEEESAEGSEETTTVKRYYVYILYNYVVGDTYKSLQEANKLNEKLLLTFDVLENDDAGFYYDLGNGKKAYSYVCHFSDSNNNSTLDGAEVTAAYDQAKFLTNLFNASALDYDVKCIKGLASGTEVYKKAAVENIFNFGSIAWTSTLTACVAAFIIITLLLVAFYKLGALSIVTTSTVTTFLSFLFMVVAGMEFNSLAIVGFILVAVVGIISGIIYNTKLKDEVYKGRTLKKANSEASRKSTLPILDVHFVSLIVGLMIYLLGGQALHTFSSVLILGTLVSAILSTLGLKGLMWLSTNTTALTGKYRYFGIEEDKVPNHMADEKQTYFGRYADKDLTKSKKPVSIIGLVAFVAAFAGVVVSGVLNHGSLFAPAKEKETISEIYIVNTIKVFSDDDTSPASKDFVQDSILANLKVYYEQGDIPTFTEEDKHDTLLKLSSEVNEFTVSESKTDEGTTTNYLHTYYQIKLSKLINPEKAYVKDKDGLIADNTTIKQAFEEYFEVTSIWSSSLENTMNMKSVKTVSNEATPDWNKLSLATFIATLIVTVYLMLRYRLSRGLATLIYPTVISAIILGLFVLLGLTGLALPASISIVIPVATIFSYVFMIMIANKERDMILDERVKDNSVEHRQELSKKALGISFTSLCAVAVIGTYLFINFFGFGPAVTSYAYIAGILGVLLSLGLVVVTYIPLSNLLFKAFSGVKVKKPSAKKNIKNVKKDTSAEPEEAIFIGIND